MPPLHQVIGLHVTGQVPVLTNSRDRGSTVFGAAVSGNNSQSIPQNTRVIRRVRVRGI